MMVFSRKIIFIVSIVNLNFLVLTGDDIYIKVFEAIDKYNGDIGQILYNTILGNNGKVNLDPDNIKEEIAMAESSRVNGGKPVIDSGRSRK